MALAATSPGFLAMVGQERPDLAHQRSPHAHLEAFTDVVVPASSGRRDGAGAPGPPRPRGHAEAGPCVTAQGDAYGEMQKAVERLREAIEAW